jgi:gamma-glutamyltranspeptidase
LKIELERIMPEKFSVFAKNGMVVSSQPLATLAGVRVLMDGGNAIDAAVATAAVLGVVEPGSVGIGGDAFALFYSAKDRALKALDASGRSPYATNFDFCRKSGFKQMPQRGIHSVTVPGAVRLSPGPAESVGGAHAIMIHPESGACVGGSDPRKGGGALGF